MRKIIPPIFYFFTENERRKAVAEYKEFENCNIPYLAVLICECNGQIFGDVEVVNMTEKEVQPFAQIVDTVIERLRKATKK